MQTDLPIKRLLERYGADLLPLIGEGDAELLGVETLELPASSTRIDTLLRLRSKQGQHYYHLLEWQGYRDLLILWRILQYIGTLGQKYAGEVVIATLVYLSPRDDVGDTLTQVVDGRTVQSFQLRTLRLWEQDAAAALASGQLGLVAISPLMRGADSALVEQAITQIKQTTRSDQEELFWILGVFAEPLIDRDRFIQLVGRERMMESKLLEYFTNEKVAQATAQTTERVTALYEARLAERDARLAEREAAQLAEREAQLVLFQQQTLTEALVARFPNAPIALLHDVQRITQPDQLRRMVVAVIQAPDLPTFERQLAEAAAMSHSPTPA